MSDAEGRALERGCHSAWVDTFSFQAPGFIPGSAIGCSANWTTRRGTSGFFCRSGLVRRVRTKLRDESDLNKRTSARYERTFFRISS